MQSIGEGVRHKRLPTRLWSNLSITVFRVLPVLTSLTRARAVCARAVEPRAPLAYRTRAGVLHFTMRAVVHFTGATTATLAELRVHFAIWVTERLLVVNISASVHQSFTASVPILLLRSPKSSYNSLYYGSKHAQTCHTSREPNFYKKRFSLSSAGPVLSVALSARAHRDRWVEGVFFCLVARGCQ